MEGTNGSASRVLRRYNLNLDITVISLIYAALFTSFCTVICTEHTKCCGNAPRPNVVKATYL